MTKTVSHETFFDGPGYQRNYIYEKIIGLINTTTEHSIINIAIYNWAYTSQGIGVKNAVNRAAQRGADINVVVCNCHIAHQLDPNICVKVFETGSIGNNKMHNKFITISDNYSVVQTSANFDGGMTGNHNNAIVMYDPRMYRAYNSYFLDLQKGETNLNYYRYLKSSSGKYKGYAFPRKSGDTILSVLNNIQYDWGYCDIHVAMAYWSNPRIKILKKLIELSDYGCSVNIIVRDAPHPAYQRFIKNLKKSGLNYRLTPNSYLYALHSKYLLIDAVYADKRRKLVFPGSPNFTGSALKLNDEVMLRIIDDDTYNAYLKNWNIIYKAQG